MRLTRDTARPSLARRVRQLLKAAAATLTGAPPAPVLEAMEARQLMASVAWTGDGGDNNWHNGDNWSRINILAPYLPGDDPVTLPNSRGVPGESDQVYIPRGYGEIVISQNVTIGGTYNAGIDMYSPVRITNNAEFRSMSFGENRIRHQFRLDGGRVKDTLDRPVPDYLVIRAPGGPLDAGFQVQPAINQPFANVIEDANISPLDGVFPTIYADGPLQNLTLDGGALVAGGILVSNGGTLTMRDYTVLGYIINEAGGTIETFGGFSLPFNANNVTDGLVRIRDGAYNLRDFAVGALEVAGGATLFLDTDATLAGALTLSDESAVITGGGSLTLNGGFSFLGGTVSGSGSLNISAGAQVVLDGPLVKTFARAVHSAGDLFFDAGAAVFSGALVSQGTFEVNAGALAYFNSNCVFAQFTQNANSLVEFGSNGAASMTTFVNSQGEFRITNADIEFLSGGLFTGSLTLSGSSASLELGAQTIIRGNALFAGGEIVGQGNLRLQVGSSVHFGGSAALSVLVNISQNAGSAISFGGSAATTVTGAISSFGSIVVQGGTTIVGSITANGSVVVNAAATLVVGGAASFFGPISVNPNGTLRVSGGALKRFESGLINDGTLRLSGAAVALGSYAGGAGQILIDGAGNVLDALVSGGPVYLDGSLRMETGAGLSVVGSLQLRNATTVFAEAGARASIGATLDLFGNITFNGDATAYWSAPVINATGGTLSLRNMWMEASEFYSDSLVQIDGRLSIASGMLSSLRVDAEGRFDAAQGTVSCGVEAVVSGFMSLEQCEWIGNIRSTGDAVLEFINSLIDGAFSNDRNSTVTMRGISGFTNPTSNSGQLILEQADAFFDELRSEGEAAVVTVRNGVSNIRSSVEGEPVIISGPVESDAGGIANFFDAAFQEGSEIKAKGDSLFNLIGGSVATNSFMTSEGGTLDIGETVDISPGAVIDAISGFVIDHVFGTQADIIVRTGAFYIQAAPIKTYYGTVEIQPQAAFYSSLELGLPQYSQFVNTVTNNGAFVVGSLAGTADFDSLLRTGTVQGSTTQFRIAGRVNVNSSVEFGSNGMLIGAAMFAQQPIDAGQFWINGGPGGRLPAVFSGDIAIGIPVFTTRDWAVGNATFAGGSGGMFRPESKITFEDGANVTTLPGANAIFDVPTFMRLNEAGPVIHDFGSLRFLSGGELNSGIEAAPGTTLWLAAKGDSLSGNVYDTELYVTDVLADQVFLGSADGLENEALADVYVSGLAANTVTLLINRIHIDNAQINLLVNETSPWTQVGDVDVGTMRLRSGLLVLESDVQVDSFELRGGTLWGRSDSADPIRELTVRDGVLIESGRFGQVHFTTLATSLTEVRSPGTVNVDLDATLDFFGDVHVLTSGPGEIELSGNIRFHDDVLIAGASALTIDEGFYSGLVNFLPGSVVTVNSGSGLLLLDAPFLMEGTLRNFGTVRALPDRCLNVSGTTLTGGTWILNGLLDLQGESILALGPGTTLTYNSGSSFPQAFGLNRVEQSAVLNVNAGYWFAPFGGVFVDDGTVNLNYSPGLLMGKWDIGSTGRLNVLSGIQTITGESSGVINVTNPVGGATSLSLFSGSELYAFRHLDGSRLEGNGQIRTSRRQFYDGTVTFAGTDIHTIGDGTSIIGWTGNQGPGTVVVTGGVIDEGSHWENTGGVVVAYGGAFQTEGTLLRSRLENHGTITYRINRTIELVAPGAVLENAADGVITHNAGVGVFVNGGTGTSFRNAGEIRILSGTQSQIRAGELNQVGSVPYTIAPGAQLNFRPDESGLRRFNVLTDGVIHHSGGGLLSFTSTNFSAQSAVTLAGSSRMSFYDVTVNALRATELANADMNPGNPIPIYASTIGNVVTISGTLLGGLVIQPGTHVRVAPTGHWILEGMGTSLRANSVISNEGDLNISFGGLATDLANSQSRIINQASGTLNVRNGALTMQSGSILENRGAIRANGTPSVQIAFNHDSQFLQSGTVPFQVGAGVTLALVRISGTPSYTNSGTFAVDGAGRLDLAMSGLHTSANPLSQYESSTGSIRLGNGAAVHTFRNSGTTLSTPSILVIDATILLEGATTLAAGTTMSGTAFFRGNGGLTIAPLATFEPCQFGDYSRLGITVNVDGRMLISRLTAMGDTNLITPGLVRVRNGGELVFSDTGGVFNLSQSPANLIHVEAGGTMRVRNSPTLSTRTQIDGALVVEPGATASFDGNRLVNFSANTLTGGTFDISGTFSPSPGAQLTANNSTIILRGNGSSAALQSVSVNNGSITLRNNATFGFAPGGGLLTNNGRLAFGPQQTTTLPANVALQNTGTIAVTDAALTILGGLPQLVNGTLAGAQWHAISTGPAASISFGGRLIRINNASLMLEGQNASLPFDNSATLTNNGTLVLRSDAVFVPGRVVNFGSFILQERTSPLHISSVVNNNLLDLSNFTMQVSTTFTQTTFGRLAITINSANDFGRITGNAAISLAGTLNYRYFGGVNTRFSGEIIRGALRTGTFDSIAFAGGTPRPFTANYTPRGMELSLLPPSSSVLPPP